MIAAWPIQMFGLRYLFAVSIALSIGVCFPI